MAISKKLRELMAEEGLDYDLLPHPHTDTSAASAEAAHVPGDRLAKAVLLEDPDGYLMAVVPATHRVTLGRLHTQFQRELGLATEGEITHLFPDCEPGALPPIGRAYGLRTVVSEELMEQPEVWIEAGDHEDLVHLSGSQFRRLVHGADTGHISRHR